MPSSRDELFGLKPPPAAPADEKKLPFSVTGFYDFLGAYTYSEPSHWSSAVNRLQLSAQGEAGPSVKWKIGGRFDIDPVYYWSDFYLSRSRRTSVRAPSGARRTSTSPPAAWSSASARRTSSGARSWASSSRTWSRPAICANSCCRRFDIIRKPQWAARAEYFKGDSHVEVVWIPFQTFDDIGKPGADFYPVRLPSPTSQTVASAFQDPMTPAQDAGQLGLRDSREHAGRRLGPRGVLLPQLRRSVRPSIGCLGPSRRRPFVFQPQHDHIWQVGGTVSKDFGPFVGRAELVYTDGRNFASTDPTAPQGVLARNTYDWVVSADFTLPQRRPAERAGVPAHLLRSPTARSRFNAALGGSVLLSAKVTPTVEPQILWIQTFGGGGGLVRPRVNWNAFKNTTLALGVDIFTGPDDGFFGRYNNRDRVYTEVRLDF